MRIDLSELLRKVLIEEFQSDREQIKNELAIAKEDIDSSRNLLKIKDWKWAHNAAYNAMLQAGRALMFHKGYRPKSESHHLAVVLFMKAVFSSKFPEELLNAMEKAKGRRHDSTYDIPGFITETQAKNLVEKAETFVSKAIEMIK